MGLAGVRVGEGRVDRTKSGRRPRRLSCISTCFSFQKKKLTLIERGGEISRRRFKVRDKLHKVKSHEAPADGGNRESLHAFLTGDRIDDCRRKMYTAEKADEL